VISTHHLTELSKKISDEIATKLVESKVTSEKINETSERYRPVARRGALLFFIMNNLHKIHTWYMFSLGSFVQFFLRGIFDAGKASEEPSRYNDGFLRETGSVQETDLVQEIEQRDALLAESDLPGRLDLLKQSVSLVIFDFVRTGIFTVFSI
jgi:dynein heavy chain, axonemal